MKMILLMQSLRKLIKRSNIQISEKTCMFKLKLTLGFFYKRYNILFFGLFLFIFTFTEKGLSQGFILPGINLSQVEASGVETDSMNSKSPMGAALRSLVIPGLGQFYNEKRLKGIFVIAGETALLYAIYNENRKFRDEKYDEVERSNFRERRDTLQWWFLFAIGASAVDAYVDAYLDKFNQEMNISYIRSQSGMNGLQVSYRF